MKVTGVVRASGKAVADVAVAVVCGPVHAAVAAMTNDEGRYAIGGLLSGRYELEVVAQDGRRLRKTVQIAEDGVLDWELG